MINPQAIINYNRTKAEKEELLMFLVCVAGKTAKTVVKQLDKFLSLPCGRFANTPFEKIRYWHNFGGGLNKLRKNLEFVKFGQYNRIEKAFVQMANSGIDLNTCTLEDLMKIHGIGRKSASCFLMWTRKGQRVSGLDTHLLKYLSHLKVLANKVRHTLDERHEELLKLLNSVEIPKSTPSSKKVYDTLEKAFLLDCDIREQKPEDRDLEIWKRYANKG